MNLDCQPSPPNSSELVLRTNVMARAAMESLDQGLVGISTDSQEDLPPERSNTLVPQINITTSISHAPLSGLQPAPSRFWILRLGYNLKLIFFLLFGFYVFCGLRRLVHYTNAVGSTFYNVGYTVVKPLSMFSIVGITCTTVGYGCPLESTTELLRATELDGLDPYRAAEVAASLDIGANRAQSLIEQVLNVASGHSIRNIRVRQGNLNFLSKKLGYMSALKNPEKLGIETKATSMELGSLGDSLIELAVDSQEFLDYFINDFKYTEDDMHTTLSAGTHQGRILFEERFADFLLRFTKRLEDYRTVVVGALDQSGSVVNSTDQLLSSFVLETKLVNDQIRAKGYLYHHLKAFTFQGQAEAFGLKTLNSASDLARSTCDELGKINDGLIRMSKTLGNISKFPDGYPVDDPARVFAMLKSTLSSLSEKRLLLKKMFGEES